MSPRKVPLPLRIEPELLARVDAARGDVSRTRWVERALEAFLDRDPYTKLVQDGPGDSGTGGMSVVTSPAPEEPVATVLGAKVFKGASVPRFKCPIARCEFTAKSPAAKCGAHGRTVVPV